MDLGNDDLSLTSPEKSFFVGKNFWNKYLFAILSEAHNLNGDLNGYVGCQRFPMLKGPMRCTPGTLDHDLKVHPFIGGLNGLNPQQQIDLNKRPRSRKCSPRIIFYNIGGILSYSSSSSCLVIQSKYPSCI